MIVISRFAVANDIPYKLVDGNDVVAVSEAARELIGDIRAGKGPGLYGVSDLSMVWTC